VSNIPEELVVAHFIVSDDVERSRRFYTEVLGGRTVISGEANDEVTYVALANSWIIINVGGGPTDDKPAVTLETPPDPDRVSSFLNIRVADIQAVYAEWSARGAQFLTPPKQHATEMRCYVRDPDGYDSVGLLVLGGGEFEPLEVGGAGPVGGCAGPPGIEPDQVDGGCGGGVLEGGFGQSVVAGGADAGDAGGLPDGALDAGADGVAVFPWLAGLFGAGGGGRLVNLPRAQEQLPAVAG